MNWNAGNTISIETLPKKCKKLTGTRFATVLGLNPWQTAFETWCECTKTFQKPFEETIYTIAGKTIEPKQAEYMKRSYFMTNLITPIDVYGIDYFKKTYGDFFPKEDIFGGMWDYLLTDSKGRPTTVLEMKTTKRAEDWEDDIPEYYALQAALYAYLLGVDDVIMVATFLEDKDYENPGDVAISAKNTAVFPFKLSERYPNFEQDYIFPCEIWWKTHIEGKVSPVYDEKKDAEILKELRKASVDTSNTEMESLLAEADAILERIEKHKAEMAEDEKRLAVIKDYLKADSMSQFEEGYTKVEINSPKYIWTIGKSTTETVDKALMKKHGVYGQYVKTSETYRMTTKRREK